jgi:hypothetical protein
MKCTIANESSFGTFAQTKKPLTSSATSRIRKKPLKSSWNTPLYGSRQIIYHVW